MNKNSKGSALHSVASNNPGSTRLAASKTAFDYAIQRGLKHYSSLHFEPTEPAPKPPTVEEQLAALNARLEAAETEAKKAVAKANQAEEKLRKLGTPKPKDEPVEPTEPVDPETKTQKERIAAQEQEIRELKKREKQRDDAAKAQEEDRRKNNVTSDLQAVANKYCKMEGHEIAMRLVLENEHRGKFVYDDARKTTVYKESEDDEGMPVTQWAEAQSKEGKFKTWIPGRSTTTKGPSNSAVSSSSDGKTEMSLAEMAQAHYQGKKIDWKKVATKE